MRAFRLSRSYLKHAGGFCVCWCEGRILAGCYVVGAEGMRKKMKAILLQGAI